MELNDKQRMIIVEIVKSWPKQTDTKKLLKILDKLAKDIIKAN